MENGAFESILSRANSPWLHELFRGNYPIVVVDEIRSLEAKNEIGELNRISFWTLAINAL